jgi:hypothetical protein
MPRWLIAMSMAALVALALAVPSFAQPQQSGLVNVNLSDNTVQIPVAIAANVCDVDVAVLVSDLRDGSADCDALSTSTADATVTPREPGSARQEGLINVNLENNTVQVPVTAAANVCDVSVLVLVQEVLGGATECTADAGAEGIA